MRAHSYTSRISISIDSSSLLPPAISQTSLSPIYFASIRKSLVPSQSIK
jgi:hypothetical protein